MVFRLELVGMVRVGGNLGKGAGECIISMKVLTKIAVQACVGVFWWLHEEHLIFPNLGWDEKVIFFKNI